MKTRAREVIEIGDSLFGKRPNLHSTWQEMALNFYPERADFTSKRSMGSEFASHLMTGAPVLARRDLANALGGMLRPRGTTWMHARTNDEKANKDSKARVWLDAATEHMRKYMYEDRSGFVRSMSESDNDWVTFGQSVVSVELNKDYNGLLYRCWHLRDCAWAEDECRMVDTMHRKWTPTARGLLRLFKGDVHDEVKRCVDREPLREFECRHIVMPIDEWDGLSAERRRRPPDEKFISLYIDVANDHIMEEKAVPALGYMVHRWKTISGTQYALSPATSIAVADARMLQQIAMTLLEAGQKAVDPAMIAVGEMIKGGVNTYAGGITYIDAAYDEKTGEALRPMTIDKTGLQWGNDREEKIREIIAESFFLNKLTMPDVGHGEMTAYETQKRVEEYIRAALPLFEPMEAENGKVCAETFALLLRSGAFGSAYDAVQMAPMLGGQEIRFVFESPLQAAANSKNATAFQTSAGILRIAAELDATIVHDFEIVTATRDAMEGAGAPATWIAPVEVAEARKKQAALVAAQQQAELQQQQQLAMAGQVGEQAGSAVQKAGSGLESIVAAEQMDAQGRGPGGQKVPV